jgi:hypothetical protein
MHRGWFELAKKIVDVSIASGIDVSHAVHQTGASCVRGKTPVRFAYLCYFEDAKRSISPPTSQTVRSECNQDQATRGG